MRILIACLAVAFVFTGCSGDDNEAFCDAARTFSNFDPAGGLRGQATRHRRHFSLASNRHDIVDRWEPHLHRASCTAPVRNSIVLLGAESSTPFELSFEKLVLLLADDPVARVHARAERARSL